MLLHQNNQGPSKVVLRFKKRTEDLPEKDGLPFQEFSAHFLCVLPEVLSQAQTL